MNLLCRASFASQCLHKSKLESSLRMLLDSNLSSFEKSIPHCGPHVANYLVQSYSQLGLTNREFIHTMTKQLDQTNIADKDPNYNHQLQQESFKIQPIERFNQTDKQQQWKIDYFQDNLAMISNSLQQVLVFGKQTTAQAKDFQVILSLLNQMNRKPQVILETQPTFSQQVQDANPPKPSYYEAIKNKFINNESQIILEDGDLFSYLQSKIMDPDQIYLKNDIAYMRQNYPQINPSITLLHAIVKQYRDAPGKSTLHLVDLPLDIFNMHLIQNNSLEHFQNLVQICNTLTLIEKVRYIFRYSNTHELPCSMCNPQGINMNYPQPIGYMNIISGDNLLYNTKLSCAHTLSQIKKLHIQYKKIMNSRDNFVICCGENNFLPILNGVVNGVWPEDIDFQAMKTNLLEKFSAYDPGQMNNHLEKQIILDCIQQQFVGDYLENMILQNGMPLDEDLFSFIAEKFENYSQQLSLEPLLNHLSSTEQQSFSNLLDEIPNGCLIDDMLFQKGQNIPTARVNRVEKKQVLRIIKDFCG